jgi:hypothetical protein
LKNNLIFIILAIICIVICYQTPFVFSDTVYFDSDGLIIDKIHYLIIVSEREKSLSAKLRNGYNSEFNVWKDPIKLRKKRIFQWRIMRSLYDPDSLPEKIETSPRKIKM